MPSGSGGQIRPILHAIADSLARLEQECRVLSQLERRIKRFARDVAALDDDIDRAIRLSSKETGRALAQHSQRIRDAVDSFQEYVRGRQKRAEHEHLIHRTDMGEHLRKVLHDATVFIKELLRTASSGNAQLRVSGSSPLSRPIHRAEHLRRQA